MCLNEIFSVIIKNVWWFLKNLYCIVCFKRLVFIININFILKNVFVFIIIVNDFGIKMYVKY